ncbi:hypothetical protein Godav_019899 [Gossypium davidsonii]|uniref:Dirigent protein n=1 Tax=Gossypium davidsonii TaxID=34287 RepID=A0A7J8R1I5_GOSDV|nr:hypothetical protein [Gossypium davidsonii]
MLKESMYHLVETMSCSLQLCTLISHLRVAGSMGALSVYSQGVHLWTQIHELAIVGGRGALRMARGFDLTQITFVNLTACNVILECNVTLYHY